MLLKVLLITKLISKFNVFISNEEFKQTLHNRFSSHYLSKGDCKIDSDIKLIPYYSWKDLIFRLLCLQKLKFKHKWCERDIEVDSNCSVSMSIASSPRLTDCALSVLSENCRNLDSRSERWWSRINWCSKHIRGVDILKQMSIWSST